ncbi:MAG: hypothetical protein K0R59_2329 [Sphingobacterium sp.]|jgi:hypothetical protein|nr:hypothetical protein [Sphingobacterium sp.]
MQHRHQNLLIVLKDKNNSLQSEVQIYLTKEFVV